MTKSCEDVSLFGAVLRPCIVLAVILLQVFMVKSVWFGLILFGLLYACSWGLAVWSLREDEYSVQIIDILFGTTLLFQLLTFLILTKSERIWYGIIFLVLLNLLFISIIYVLYQEFNSNIYNEERKNYTNVSQISIYFSFFLLLFYTIYTCYNSFYNKNEIKK